MNILMMTNTYLPMVGGVPRSVATFADEFRRLGHRVLVVAPEFDKVAGEEDVIRVPAIQRFNGSDFSVRLPIPGFLSKRLSAFRPDLVHAHHPFLLGDAAVRIAAGRGLPLVFTHHTMYEQYTHYVPGGFEVMKRFVIRLATEYANLCDQVIAPSQSIAEVLRARGVRVPVEAVPTGIDLEQFRNGNGSAYRRAQGIAEDAFLIGHVGRLAPEKNLVFLAEAVAGFLRDRPEGLFLVVGSGPSVAAIRDVFHRHHVPDRLRLAGTLQGQTLSDAYAAMDAFVFASKSETQGLVLAEAMATGTPVVAVDAPGVREVVRDGVNGRLLKGEDLAAFRDALSWVHPQKGGDDARLAEAARETAAAFACAHCAQRVLDLYRPLLSRRPSARSREEDLWTQALRVIEAEWNLWAGKAEAAADAVTYPSLPIQDNHASH